VGRGGIAVLAAVLALLVVAPAAAQKGTEQDPAKAGAPPPQLDARAWVLIDRLDDAELAAHAAERELPIASATKLMTVYLALERLRPSQRLRAPAYRPTSSIESLIGLQAGERMTVRDLLYGLLLESGNDAAATLAVGVSGSVNRFVALMNRTARRLGLEHTHYTNPIGFDAAGNYSSAGDLAELADRLLQNRLFARIVRTPAATLRSGEVSRRFTNRNTLLLSRPDLIVGVKTGHTVGAGYVLVAAARRDGATLISAVLGTGSESQRDAESLELLQYGLSQYRSRQAVARGEQLADPALEYLDERLELVAARRVTVSTRRGQRVGVEVEAPDEVQGPVERGERLGRVLVTVDGRVEGSSPLIAADRVAAASVGDKALYFAQQPWILIPAGLIVIVIGLWIAMRGRREGAEGAEPHQGDEPDEGVRPEEEGEPRPDASDGSPGEAATQDAAPVAGEQELCSPASASRKMPGDGPPKRTPEERRAMHEQRRRRREEGR
jgi:serine-type D-Ala-D-Ala carboxypeptidase (penicillin-binding protein 5/6)